MIVDDPHLQKKKTIYINKEYKAKQKKKGMKWKEWAADNTINIKATDKNLLPYQRMWNESRAMQILKNIK